MKKVLTISLLCLLSLSVSPAMAVNKTVTINWTTSGSTEDVQSYKMIYSYSSNMANPIDACQTNDNTVTSLTCENVEITSQDVYFKIIAIRNQHPSTGSNVQHVSVPLESSISVVQGFMLEIPNQNPPPPSSGIFDDFSTDTSSHYSFISGSISVNNGQAHGERWKRSIGYHTTSLGKADQKVSAICSFNDRDYASVAARVNPTNQTGYFVSIRSGDLTLHSFSGSSSSWVAGATHSFSSPVKIELSVTGNHIVVKVNDAVLINTTDNTYSTGNFCGPVLCRGFSNTDITLDNFSGQAQ